MRPRFSRTLAVPIPESWNATLTEMAAKEFRPVTSIAREMLVEGLRSRGVDPFATVSDNGNTPEAA